MDLTDGATFPTALIKCAKSRLYILKKSRDTKRFVHIITINNGWNARFIQILCEEHYCKFLFKGNMLSILPTPIGLSQQWVLAYFKYQEPEFHARLFGGSEEGTFAVPTGRTKVGLIIKPVPGAPKLYVLNKIKSYCALFLLPFAFFFVDEKVAIGF